MIRSKKRKAFIKEMLKPETTITQSAINAGYSEKTAYSIGSELMKIPEIQSELAKHSTAIEEIISSKTYELTSSEKLEAVKEGLLNARWMHDKIHGKATQRVETENKSISINISLK